MKKLQLFTVTLLLILPGSVWAAKDYALVGFSTDWLTGHSGVFRFTRACQSDYGPTARMCNSVEAMESVYLVGMKIGHYGWIRPVLVGDGTRDASGTLDMHLTLLDTTPSLSCNGWDNWYPDPDTGRLRGLTINGNGQFHLRACTTELHVACCVPGGGPIRGQVDID